LLAEAHGNRKCPKPDEKLIFRQAAKRPKMVYFRRFRGVCRLWVARRVAYRSDFGYFAPMPATPESLAALEHRLAERLLEFERLGEAWPKGRDAVERAEIGRQREDALIEIVVKRKAESAATIIVRKLGLAETPMEWDKVVLALTGIMFVTLFPGGTVELHYDGYGGVKALPPTQVPDKIIPDEVVYLQHPEWSFEIQVLNDDTAKSVTKLIFGPTA
jgi:hypothetical protein